MKTQVNIWLRRAWMAALTAAVIIAFAASLSAQILCQADFTWYTNPFNPGYTVDFTNTSQNNNPNQLNAQWSFGDGTSSTQYSPVHTYANPGVYQVCLVVWSGNCQSSFCDSVVVGGFVNPCINDYTVALTANGNNTITMELASNNPAGSPVAAAYWFLQNVPQNVIGSGNPFVYSVNALGTYTFCANYILQNGYQCLACETITLNAQNCQANFVSSDMGLVNPGLFAFANTSTGAYTDWSWDFGDGSPMEYNTDPTDHLYLPGSYNVCLTIWDAVNGCQSSTCDSLEVLPNPPNSCGYAINYTANPAYNTVDLWLSPAIPGQPFPSFVEWYIPNGLYLGNGIQLSYNFPNAGLYYVCADYVLGGVNCTACDSILVGQNAGNCNDYGVSYTATLNGNVTAEITSLNGVIAIPSWVEWHWVQPNGNQVLLGVNSPVLNTGFNAAGTYQICVDFEVNGIVCQQCFTVTIAPQGGGCQAFFEANPYNGPLQVTYCVVFENLSQGWTEATWDFGDGITQIDSNYNVFHCYPGPGNYNACLYTFDATTGCTDTFCLQVIVDTLNNCGVLMNYTTSNLTGVFGLNGIAIPNVVEWYYTTPNGAAIPMGNNANQTYTFPVSGTYYVCAYYEYNTNPPCVGTVCSFVTVVDSNACVAAFNASNLGSNVIQFDNQSVGGFTNVLWEFGDLATSNDFNPIHTYNAPGVYNVCLSIWEQNGCQSYICQDVTISVVDSTCYFTDCVFPGDANYDQVANNFDVLNIGIGHNIQGLPRPNATLNWVGQYAPDWNQQFVNGVNLKHADCDGNAIINNDDLDAIYQNYGLQHDGISPRSGANAPTISIVFPVDTIIMAPAQSSVTVTADIILGDVNFPAQDVYGIAFSLEYPSQYVQANTLDVQYDGQSWFGGVFNNITFVKDMPAADRADVAFTRISHTNESGYGRIGTVTFTIIDDIVERNEAVLPVLISRVMLVDADGNELLVNGSASEVLITDGQVVGTQQPNLESQVRVFPNPTQDVLNIQLGDLEAVSITLFNTLGQIAQSIPVTNGTIQTDMSQLSGGIYLLQVQTAQGSVTKRVVLNK